MHYSQEKGISGVTLDDILSCDVWAREYVAEKTKNVAASSAPILIV